MIPADCGRPTREYEMVSTITPPHTPAAESSTLLRFAQRNVFLFSPRIIRLSNDPRRVIAGSCSERVSHGTADRGIRLHFSVFTSPPQHSDKLCSFSLKNRIILCTFRERTVRFRASRRVQATPDFDVGRPRHPNHKLFRRETNVFLFFQKLL